MRTKSSLDQLVGGEEISAKVMRQQDEGNDETSNNVPHNHLKEGEIRVVGEAGDTDDSQRAGFGGDDGDRNRPPRDVTSSKEVVAKGALSFAEAQAKQSDADEVNGNDREVEALQAH